MSKIVVYAVSGESLENLGMTSKHKISGVALVTYGLIFPGYDPWMDYDPTVSCTWSAYDPVATNVWSPWPS